MELNFEGSSFAGVFKLTEERERQLPEILATIATDIISNHENYSHKRKATIDGREREITEPHYGKILQRFFNDLPDEADRLFVIGTTDGMVEIMRAKIAKKNLKSALFDFIKDL